MGTSASGGKKKKMRTNLKIKLKSTKKSKKKSKEELHPETSPEPSPTPLSPRQLFDVDYITDTSDVDVYMNNLTESFVCLFFFSISKKNLFC